MLQILANMKTCIFLLTLLGFVRLCFASQSSNATVTPDLDYVSYNLFRRKRANIQYTRWRDSEETTPRFIVKVLDEDVPPKPVVGVNNLPLTIGQRTRDEKLIVGGVIVPPHITQSTDIQPLPGVRDYTRFVLPKKEASSVVSGVNVVVAPSRTMRTPPEPPVPPPMQLQFAPEPHPLRDDTPPVGPKFIPRPSSGVLTRQYAPVTPVAFKFRTFTPVTPKYPTKVSRSSRPTLTTLQPLPTLTTLSEEYLRIPDDLISYRHPDDSILTPPIDWALYSTLEGLLTPIRTPKYSVPTRSPERPTADRTSKDTAMVQTNPNEDETDVTVTVTRTRAATQPTRTTSESSAGIHHFNDNYFDIIGQSANKDAERSKYGINDIEKAEDIMFEDDETDGTKSNYDNYDSSSSSDYNSSNSSMENIGKKRKTNVEPDSSTFDIEQSSNPVREKRKCSLVHLRTLNIVSPRTLPEITAQLKKWAEDSPMARWVDITDGNLTVMENPIYMMIVDDPSSGQILEAKRTVLVIAGIQGRDHYAVTSAMYILYQLIERSEAHAELLSRYRFWIIPVFNPDGYDYSMTFPQKREWTKNLRQDWDTCEGRQACKACETYGVRCTVQPCYGVNLDRNFEYQWIPTDIIHTENPCGPLYAGRRQLSEAETRALTHYLEYQLPPPAISIALKEGEVLGVMYPYSHTKKKRAFDEIYKQRAQKAANAANSINGRPYVAGQTSEFLPLYAGGIEDWVDGHMGIDNTYTIVMYRPSDKYVSPILGEHAIHEAYAAMDTLLLYTATRHEDRRSAEVRAPVVVPYAAQAVSAPAPVSNMPREHYRSIARRNQCSYVIILLSCLLGPFLR